MNKQNNSSMEGTIGIEDLHNLLNQPSDLYLNIREKVIVITEDKLRICLIEHIKNAEEKRTWITPLCILIAVILTCVTTTFHDAWFDASTWKAIFLLVGAMNFAWLLWGLNKLRKSKKIEYILEEVKKEAIELKFQNKKT